MNEIHELDVANAMIAYGGKFVARLGELYHQADPINRAKLREAFPEYWTKYTELVKSETD